MFWNWLIEHLKKIGTEYEWVFTLFEFVVTIFGIIQGTKFFIRIKEYINKHRKRENKIEDLNDSINTSSHEVKDEDKTVNLIGIFSSFFVTLTCIFVIFACSLYIKSYYSGSENKGKISISDTDTTNNISSQTEVESEDKTDTESTTKGFWFFWRNTTKGTTQTTSTMNNGTTQASDAKSTTDSKQTSESKSTSKTTSTTTKTTSSTTSNPAGVIQSGETYDNISFILYENGHLKVNGPGRIYGEPWWDYRKLIKSVSFSNDITVVSGFQQCSNITTITLPSTCTLIFPDAFLNCHGLKTITIPKAVKNIRKGAFSGCENLKNVYYRGSEEEWKTISIESNNECLINSTIHYS